MENEIKVFENTEFGKVRTLFINDEPYFVGKDVTEILGYQNGSRDINRHVDEEDRDTTEMVSPQGTIQKTTVINESGLYSLILGSKLASAKKFKKWVTSEVLPTIRKTGGYVSNDDMFVNTYLPFADDNTKNLFKLQLQTINQLNRKIESDKPKVEFAEAIQVSEDCISMNDMAKLAGKNGCKIGRNRLFEYLRGKKVLNDKNIPYQKYIGKQPWFQVKESTYFTYGTQNIQLTAVVTPQGQNGIIRMLKKRLAN